MNRRLVVVILLVVVLGGGLAYVVMAVANSTIPAAVGEPAPDFTLETLDGKAVSLSDFYGEPVIVNFFTTWCEPCRSEAPVLQQFEEQHGDRVHLILVDRAEPAVLVEQFINEFGLSMTILLDSDNQVSKQYGVVGQPETLVIDENGVLRYHQVGEMTLDVMLDLVERYTNAQ